MTVRDCLTNAILLEDGARKLYEELARRHAPDSALQAFFTAMALEEEQHAARLLSLARHLEPEELDAESPARLTESMSSMEKEMAAIVEEDARLGPGGLASILQRLVDFENWYTCVHAEDLCDLFAPKLKPIFASLAEQDRTHHELVDRARRALSQLRVGERATP